LRDAPSANNDNGPNVDPSHPLNRQDSIVL
jgi:hypothetical protein